VARIPEIPLARRYADFSDTLHCLRALPEHRATPTAVPKRIRRIQIHAMRNRMLFLCMSPPSGTVSGGMHRFDF
jgi:hypothetical protein